MCIKKRTKGCKLLLVAAALFALGGSLNLIGCSSSSDDSNSGEEKKSAESSETETVIGELALTQAENEDKSVTITATPSAETTTATSISYTFALTETNDSVTVTNNNDGTATLTNTGSGEQTVTVKVTASASGATDVSNTISVTLSDPNATYYYELATPTLTAGDSDHSAGTRTVTALATLSALEGGDAENLPSVSYEFTVTDSDGAALASDSAIAYSADEDTLTLTNSGETTLSVSVSVKASAENAASKSASLTVKVPAKETFTLSEVTLSATSGSAETSGSVSGVTATATVSSSDSATESTLPTVTYTWSTDYSGISFDDETASEVTISVASTAKVGTATITVTASADACTSTSATYTLTITKGYAYTVYSQDFESVSDIGDVVTAASSTYNPTIALVTGDATYGSYGSISFNSSNARGQTATIATGLPATLTTDYKVEFDMRLAGPNATKSTATQAAQFVLASDAINTEASSAYSGSYLFALYNYVYGTDSTEENSGHTNGSQNNLWYVSLDSSGTEITIDRTLWYHYTIVVDEKGAVTATILGSDGTYALGSADAGASVNATSTAFCYMNMLLGRAAGCYYIDNMVVKSNTDVIVFTEKASVEAASETIAATGSTTLTASAAAGYAGAGTAVTPTYSWALASADADYAELSVTSDGTSATLTGKNSTISDYSATVTLTVTVGTGDTAVTSTATQTVTVSALDTLLSGFAVVKADSGSSDDSTLAESDSTYTASINTGDKLVLTASATAKASSADNAEDAAVTYSYTANDYVGVTVNDSTITLTGSAVTSGTELALTATAGSVTKTLTITVTVVDVPIIALNVYTSSSGTTSATSATLLYGVTDTATLYAITTPSGVSGITYAATSSNESVATVAIDKDGVLTITNALTAEPTSAQKATITVTAEKDGSDTQTTTVEVTVKAPVWKAVFTKNYTASDDSTTVSSLWTAYVNNWGTTDRMTSAVTDGVDIVSASSNNNGAAVVTGSSSATTLYDIADGASFQFQFDMMLSFVSSSNKIFIGNGSGFPLSVSSKNPINYGTVNADVGYLLKLNHKTSVTSGATWTINDGDQTVNLNSSIWYTFLIERYGDDTYLTITPQDSTVDNSYGMERTKLSNTYTAGGLGKMVYITKPTGNANLFSMDNVIIRTLSDE